MKRCAGLLMVMMASWGAQAEEWTPLEKPLAEEGFEVIAREQGVTVYQDKNAKNIRVAAEGVIAAPPEVVLKALLDYQNHQGIVKRVSEVRILKQADHFLIVYQHVNLPVISDRDYTLFVTWGTSGQDRWIVYHVNSEWGPPEKDGIVRVTDHAGSWQLMPLNNGTITRLRFQMSIDLAGWLPRWMARSKAGDEVPDLFASINTLVRNEAKAQRGDRSCTSRSC